MKVPTMKKDQKGFTLLELLVVISIIGILAALLLANLNSVRERARDATRQSDIKQYQTALGEYASENTGIYVVANPAVDICDITGSLTLTTCIDDPQPSAQHYRYVSNAGGTEYAIWAQLENSANLWVLCSNGLVGETLTVPTGLAVCPL